MTEYEYKVIPAPNKGIKATGVKTPEDRFALGLQTAMNAEATGGWEYLRSETLPSIERKRLASAKTIQRTVLVFRRPHGAVADMAPAPAEARVEPVTDNPPAGARKEPVLVAPVVAETADVQEDPKPLHLEPDWSHASPEEPQATDPVDNKAEERPD